MDGAQVDPRSGAGPKPASPAAIAATVASGVPIGSAQLSVNVSVSVVFLHASWFTPVFVIEIRPPLGFVAQV